MGEETNVCKPKLINFYSWLEAKLPETRFDAILNSVIEPMQNQGVAKSTITAILKQLSMDCKIKLTPLPLEFVQQHITRPQSRSCSPEERDEVINISSDESSDEDFFIKPPIHRKNRKWSRICSDDDEEVSDNVTSEIGKSSRMETEIQVSIKVYGPDNIKSKNVVKDNQEVYPTVQPINLQIQNNSTPVCNNVTLLDRSNISDIDLYNSSPSNENKQLGVSSDDICFDKLNIKKRVKMIEYFGEDSVEIPELKKIKIKPLINKNNPDKKSLKNSNKRSTKDSVVKKKKRKRKHLDDIEHSSVPNTGNSLATYKSEANNKKDRLVEENQSKEKLSLDIKNKSNNKMLRRKRKPKSQKNNSIENNNMMKRNAPVVSSDSGHHFTGVTSLSVVSNVNNSVGQLWSNLGMESPTERSENILKSFPLCTSTQLPTTYTDSNSDKHDEGVILENADKVASQKDSNTNKITNNLNHLEDQSKFQVLTNKVVRTVGQNDMDAISDVRQIKNAGSTSFPHLEENINVSEAINSYDKTSKNNLEHDNIDNVGKIRLRDPKTLMKNSENIHIKDGSSTLPVNNVIIHSPNQTSSNRFGVTSPPPSYIFHYLQNSGYKHQPSEIRQKKDCGIKERDYVGFENLSKIIYSELCKWFFDEVIELKTAKMSEILHLVIADKICKDERVKRATKLMSESSIAEEKRRVDREYSDTLRIRGNEFKALFNDIVHNFSFLPSKEIMIIVLYCKIINGLLKIEDTNRKYCMSARTLICEILKKNNYKNPLVYDLLSLSDTNFEQKYFKVQSVLSILIAKKSEGMHINNTKSSAKENPSHETESQMSNACNEVSLAFNLGRKLDQLIKNKEYHISVHQQNNRSPTITQINIQQQREMGCDTVLSVPENESINNQLVPSSVIKHTSTPNTVTCPSSFTNYNQNSLPVHSVLNTTQEHQQKIMKPPPPPYSMGVSHNIATVNPNINSDSRSIENRNSNSNVQQKIRQTQSSKQINDQASALEHVGQLSNQQAQNIQTSTDKSHYYRQQFSEHQKIAHMQDGYKQLSPQTQQVGTSIETQKNKYIIPVATQQQQNMQPQNIYRHLPLETQQPKQIHNSYRVLPQYAQQFVQPSNSFNAQQMHRSTSIENEQNIQKQTNYSHLLTQLAGAKNNNYYRVLTKPTNIENGQASNQIQTPEQHVITSKEQNNINHQNYPVKSQSNNQSELYNYSKDNPHSISYARLRQTSAIQEYREIKRALVQPMINKPAGQLTASVQSQKPEINLNNSMPHNEDTTLSQLQSTFPSKEIRSIFFNPKQRPEIQKLDGQKSIEYWGKTSNQVQSNVQNNNSDFGNKTQETVSNSTSNPLTYTSTQSEISDNVSSHVTQQNTLHTINNIMDSRLNHQINVGNQNQQGALSSLPSNPISSPRHNQTVHTNVTRTSDQSQLSQNKSPQRSSSTASSSNHISSLKHGQTVNTNICLPSSLCEISQNTSSSTAASSSQISSPRHNQTVHTNVPRTSSQSQISQNTSLQRSPPTIEYIDQNSISRIESLIPSKQNLLTKNVNQNQNDSINANLHQTFQNFVISQNKETVFHQNPRRDEQNKLNQSNVTSNQSGIVKPPLEPQSNSPIDVLKKNEEYLEQLLKRIAQTTQDQTQNVGLQIAYNKYISAFHEMKEQLNYSHVDLCQNKVVSNVPVQREAIQPHTSLSMNQCQTPSGRLPVTHQNLTKSHAWIQPNNQDVMPRQVHHQQSMDHSFLRQIQIHSVHSQAPSSLNKEHHEMNPTYKQINICGSEKCSNEATVLCSGCRSTVYCSKNCQRNHWYEGHHVVCTADISNQ